MTKAKPNASTAMNMQLRSIKKDGENGDLITIEFMADKDYIVASEWVDVVKAVKIYEDDMVRHISFGGATIDGHIEINGITVNHEATHMFANGGDFEQQAKDEAIHFYTFQQMQRFIQLEAFKQGKINQLDIEHEDYIPSLHVTSVKGWQVEGADTDEKVFYYKLDLSNSGVGFYAWAYVDGLLVEFILDERDGLDDVIMDHYRKLQEDQFALFKDVVEELEAKIADRKNEDLFDWDEGAAA